MQVRITGGFYRGAEIEGVFDLAEAYKVTPSGKQIVKIHAVEGMSQPVGKVIQIQVPSEDAVQYQTSDGEPVQTPHVVTTEVTSESNVEKEYLESESEDEAMDRIKRTFEILEELTDAASEDIIRGMVVCGPPGIGKSYGVEERLRENNMFRTVAGKQEHYDVIKGAVSPIGLYRKLYMNRAKGFVTVFDDCDSVLHDEDCLNMLKSALDSSDKRYLSWLKESRVLREEDIPDKYEFEGSVIFLTNIDFEKSRGKIADHLAAIQSRCHYLDLEIGSQRDQVLRIKQIVREGMLKDYAFSKQDETEVVNYIVDNADYLRELSLRTVRKVADLKAAKPQGWEEYCEATVLKRTAKFARLAKRKAS
jgi:hypothetical protein